MASHLTIISGTPGHANARNFSGAGEAENSGMAGLFAALLGGKPAETAPARVNDAGKSETDLTGLFQLGLEAASGGGADGEADHAEAIAAALDLNLSTEAPADPAPMVNFVEALSALKASLDRGEPLDPDLLARAEQALGQLAEALGLDLAALPVPDDFAALLAGMEGEDGGLAGALNQLLSPLAQALAGAQPAETPDAIAGAEAAQDRLKALGDKLAALLAALEDGAIAADKLAAIGMKPGTSPAEEVQAALARFAAPMGTDGDVPQEPVLATASLKIDEKVLTGRTGEATAETGTNGDGAKPTGQAEPRADERRAESPQRDTRPPATTAPSAQEPVGSNVNSAPAQQDQSALRIEAIGTRAAVQSGYQTSQQQLNLPQLAFEMARQVQDGNSRFQIRLDPPELGRIDVRLDIDKAGQVTARLTVEKSETLDLMQRDQRALERALQQAGLDSGKTNLEFSLKQNPFAGQGDRQDRGGEASLLGNDPAGGDAEEAPPTVNLYRGSLQASGVNIIA